MQNLIHNEAFFSPCLSHVGQFLPADHCALLFHFLTVRFRVDRFSVTFWFETDSRRPELCSALFVWLTLNMQWQKDTDIWTQSVFSKLQSFEIWWSASLAGSHFHFNYCHYLLNRVMFYYFKNSAGRFWYGENNWPKLVLFCLGRQKQFQQASNLKRFVLLNRGFGCVQPR